jgi:hypothetical protein
MGKAVTRHPNLFVVLGEELSTQEIEQMTASLYREFRVSPKPESFRNKIFFLLKDGEEILAMAGLWEVAPFVFDGKSYTVHALVEVVANVKNSGYGKRVVCAIHDYLLAKNLTGFGFCAPKTSEFYKKCGFEIARGITSRFIYQSDGKDITNQDGQIIFYIDNSEELMKNVAARPQLHILLPTQELW